MWRRKARTGPALLDAEAAHRAAPQTYSIPRRVIRESLRPGDQVKLLFQVSPPSAGVEVERMWVEVTSASGGEYVGRLANQPHYLPALKPGDEVVFGPRHVAARDARADDPLYTDPDAFAVVSRRVWDNEAWSSRLERHEMPDPQLSGWFVLAGDETDQYRADPNNFMPIAQAVLFDRFIVLDSGLEGPIGTTMVWDEAAVEYVAAAD